MSLDASSNENSILSSVYLCAGRSSRKLISRCIVRVIHVCLPVVFVALKMCCTTPQSRALGARNVHENARFYDVILGGDAGCCSIVLCILLSIGYDFMRAREKLHALFSWFVLETFAENYWDFLLASGCLVRKALELEFPVVV